jgi:hypothetical protein
LLHEVPLEPELDLDRGMLQPRLVEVVPQVLRLQEVDEFVRQRVVDRHAEPRVVRRVVDEVDLVARDHVDVDERLRADSPLRPHGVLELRERRAALEQHRWHRDLGAQSDIHAPRDLREDGVRRELQDGRMGRVRGLERDAAFGADEQRECHDRTRPAAHGMSIQGCISWLSG